MTGRKVTLGDETQNESIFSVRGLPGERPGSSQQTSDTSIGKQIRARREPKARSMARETFAIQSAILTGQVNDLGPKGVFVVVLGWQIGRMRVGRVDRCLHLEDEPETQRL